MKKRQRTLLIFIRNFRITELNKDIYFYLIEFDWGKSFVNLVGESLFDWVVISNVILAAVGSVVNLELCQSTIYSRSTKKTEYVLSRRLLSFSHDRLDFLLSPSHLSVSFLFIYKFEKFQANWHETWFWFTSKVSLFFLIGQKLFYLFSGISLFFVF